MKANSLILFVAILINCFVAVKAQENNLKAYNNYDFIPGEKIVFIDDFLSAPDGEFPPKWNLKNGQPVVNKFDGEPVLLFNECEIGSPCKVEPAMKTKNYLGKAFTVEFDFFLTNEDDMMMLFLIDNQEEERFINFKFDGEVSTGYFEPQMQGNYPDADQYIGRWHHAAIAYRDGQLKVYVDQHRVLVVPKCGFNPLSCYLGGCADVRVKNVLLAEGGGMNMLGKLLTDGKLVSYAIKFDVGKSEIKGESMGFLNNMAKWLKENPTIKLEIGGHTDSDGDNAANQILSQARAEAVKQQLEKMGVAAGRLTIKGYGETKPIDNNTTLDGKANNRRVEFVKSI